MAQIINVLNSQRRFPLVSLLWIFVWFIPWGNWLTVDGSLYLVFIVDMLKLGVALGVFLLPGALLYVLLRDEHDSLADLGGILPIGFTFSVMMIAVIGLTGRIFGISFALVKALFAFVGLVELILLPVFRPGFAWRKADVERPFQSMFQNVSLVLALVLAISMAFNEQQFFLDDMTYAAYVTNWQYSTHLGFNNIVHHADVLEHARFWLALYPMGQALLSDLSGVPGILLFSSYLELYLVPFAVITAYWFACTLGLSRRAAGFSVLAQVVLYTLMIYNYWPVGFWFLLCMIEDKVTAVFLLAPVFFVFILKFLQAPVRSNLVLVLLCGTALMLTHPVILFYSCLIAAGMMGFSWYAQKTGWRQIVKLCVVFFVVVLPYLLIRLYSSFQGQIAFNAQEASTTFHADRFINVLNDVFYGIHPEVLKLFDISSESNFYSVFQIFRLLPIILALTAGVLAFIRIKAGALYWYIASCVLLVTFAAIPYTGWILGYFVSARLISRASWFSPLGLAGTLISILIFEYLKSNLALRKLTSSYVDRIKRDSQSYARLLNFSISVIALAIALALPRVSPYFEVLDHNYQLAQVGAYVDGNTRELVTVIALDYGDTQLLPSVIANASLISFREETDQNAIKHFLSIDEIHERIYASNTIQSLDPSVSYQERCRLLKKFNVRFVLASSSNADSFAAEVNKCGMAVENVFDTKDMILLELQ